jgi:hypothetical protein
VTADGMNIVDGIFELVVGEPLGEHATFCRLFRQKNVRARGVLLRHEPDIFIEPIPILFLIVLEFLKAISTESASVLQELSIGRQPQFLRAIQFVFVMDPAGIFSRSRQFHEAAIANLGHASPINVQLVQGVNARGRIRAGVGWLERRQENERVNPLSGENIPVHSAQVREFANPGTPFVPQGVDGQRHRDMLSSIVHPPFRMLLPDGARRTSESLRAHGQHFGGPSVPDEIRERFGDAGTLAQSASVFGGHESVSLKHHHWHNTIASVIIMIASYCLGPDPPIARCLAIGGMLTHLSCRKCFA